MSSTPNQGVYMLPTLQSRLIGQLTTIHDHLNQGNRIAAWFALKTLYEMGLSDVQAKTKTHFNQITQRLKQATDRFKNPNWLMQEMAQQSAMERVLSEEVEPFFMEISTALQPYLEKQPLQPRSRGDGRLRLE